MSTISGAPITHEPLPSKLAALHLRADENGTAPLRSQPSGAGNDADERHERRVAVLVVGERAERSRDVDARRRAACSSSNTISPSVSVPVLSRHTTSTRASPSTAGQLLHEHLAPGQRDRGDHERDAREQHQAFRHHADDAGDRAAQRVVEVAVLELAPDEQGRRRDDHPGDDAQDRVDAVHQLGAGELEPSRLGRELRRVGVAADARVAWKRPEPATTKLPGQHLVVDVLVQRIALTREQRLVDLEPVGVAHDAVARDLVAGAEHEQVVEHDALDRDLRVGAVARHARARRVEHRERVERALRPHLLHDADERVGDEDHAERGVLDRPDDDDHHEHRAEDGVEAREHVRPHDLADGAAGALAGLVHLPAGDALPRPRPRSGPWAASPGGRTRLPTRRP